MKEDIPCLPTIQGKFDTDSAGTIVAAGYPANKAALEELIFWSCFPNDPVCWVAHPYVAGLRDEVLAPALAGFIAFHLEHAQEDLIADAFWLFINKRGEAFRARILAHATDDATRAVFATPKYSLETYAEERRRFDALRAQDAPPSPEHPQHEIQRVQNMVQRAQQTASPETIGELVAYGNPDVEGMLSTLIGLACAPHTAGGDIALTYLRSLRDELLAPALARFMAACRDGNRPAALAQAQRLLIDGRDTLLPAH